MANEAQHPRNSHLQLQIGFLAALLVAGLLLVSYRAEVAARSIRQVNYDACQARADQAREVNLTRAAVGRLIIAMVPDAPAQAKANMLRGMTTTEQVHPEDCESFRP